MNLFKHRAMNLQAQGHESLQAQSHESLQAQSHESLQAQGHESSSTEPDIESILFIMWVAHYEVRPLPPDNCSFNLKVLFRKKKRVGLKAPPVWWLCRGVERFQCGRGQG